MHKNVALWCYQGPMNSTGVYNALIYRICIHISVLHIPAFVMQKYFMDKEKPLVLHVCVITCTIHFNIQDSQTDRNLCLSYNIKGDLYTIVA